VIDVLHRLLAPWRTASTWRMLVHAVLDLPMGVICFVPTVVLLAATVVLSITLPLAIVTLSLALAWTRVASTIERSRFEGLHGVRLPDAVAPPPAGSAWQQFKAKARSKARWKQVAFCLLRLPVGVTIAVVTILTWCWSLALVGLPFYRSGLPEDTAHFDAFFVGSNAAAAWVGVVGLVGLVAIAPWVTITAGRLDLALARVLLTPGADVELEAKVVKAETGRAAAVDAAESERRRIERDLHDGAQQRLVALAMDLGAARERLDSDPEAAKALVAEAHEEAKAALREIRDLVRGIHPVILEDRGLDAALSAVVARSPVPVHLDVQVGERPSAAVESAAYFVVSEALANVARHARAEKANVGIVRAGDRLIVEVRDDGVGGADPTAGTGLAGLAERVVGMGGTMDLLSPAGGPTTLLVELPCAS
jgi:signal transduction histidine kinase